MILAAQLLVDCLGYHYCSTGRRVLLLIVVLLNDFNIELTAEYLSSLARKLHKQVYTERHVECEEHRDLSRSRGYLRALLIGVACRGEHQRNVVHLAIAEQVRKRGGVREIDDNIGLFGHVEHLGVHREFVVLLAEFVDSGDDGAVRALLNKTRDHSAHSSTCACYCDSSHL